MRRTLEERLEPLQQTDIDLAPLLDVVFILLIFFIVTTVFVKETGIDVDKPKAVSTQKLERTVVMIAISAEREVVYDGTNIGVAGVRSTISQALRRHMRPVVIQTDKRVPTELFVKVLDQVKLAGAEQVSIATVGSGE
ncbi:MAG: biopolymer transporter ExbD [Alteromonadaceae bacterium]|nr:MAG: biopolymer transporter ExbD [Alteromonadaceae bacterium]